MSDDGATALVVIAMIGNPFSPWYARERARGADPLAHAAVNVALYGPRARSWAFTERRVTPADRFADGVTIGGSALRWERDALVVDLDERTSPFPRVGRGRLRGRVVVRPEVLPGVQAELDPRGRHVWWPVAPRARVEATFAEPDLVFCGTGYHDANAGVEPLEAAFDRWTWSRGHARSGVTRIAYDVAALDRTERSISFDVDARGDVRSFEGTEEVRLGRSRWGLERRVRVDTGESPTLVRSVEDAPFYARAQVRARQRGDDLLLMHETMSVARLRARWVRRLLPFRMAKG